MALYQTYKTYFREILKLSYPIVIGQIGIVLMGVADVVMIGRIDSTNLAAAGAANAVYFFVTILGIGTLTAISPLVAKAKGAGHNNEAALLFRQGLKAALILGVFITVVVYFLTINFHWFGQTPEITALAKVFLHLLNTSTIFFMLFLAAKQFSDGLSFTKPSAMVTIIGLGANILINFLLIYGMSGFPKLGLAGAGISTSLTRFLMMIGMLWYVLKQPVYKKYLHVKERVNASHLLKDIFSVGLPSGLQYFFEVGAFSSAALIVGWFGQNELAAHNIAISLASVTYMIATGLSAGGSIAVGDAWGRRHKIDLIRSGRAALLLSVMLMSVTALIFTLFNHSLVTLYIEDPVVGDMAAGLLLIAALFQLGDGIQCVSLGILRGIADTRVPTIVTIIAYWVIGIPSGFLFAYTFGLSFYGIWFGLSLGLTFSAILLSIRFIKESRAFDFAKEERDKFKELIAEK